MKRLLAFFLVIALMLCSALPVIADEGDGGGGGGDWGGDTPDIPSGPQTRPSINKQPKDVTVVRGGTAAFSVGASGATGITWQLVNPVTGETVLASKAAARFSGLRVSGPNNATLKLIKVPEELSGWQVFCKLTNRKGSTTTRYALLTVTDKKGNPLGSSATLLPPDATSAPEEPDEGDPVSDFVYLGSSTLAVTTFGASMTGGQTYLDFSAEGEVTVTVTASAAPDYWVINGARYTFSRAPRAITISHLAYPLTIEAVGKGATPRTLLTDAQLEARRTGDPLTVTSENADMCHIKSNGAGAGGWFNQFDFTKDFKNRASGKKEKGGRVSLLIRASVPEGKRVIAWEMNGARFDFTPTTSEMRVENLNETMAFRPVMISASAPDPTPTPSVFHTVSCEGCVFRTADDAQWRDAGSLPEGSTILVRPQSMAAIDAWVVNGETLALTPTTITLRVTQETTILCQGISAT